MSEFPTRLAPMYVCDAHFPVDAFELHRDTRPPRVLSEEAYVEDRSHFSIHIRVEVLRKKLRGFPDAQQARLPECFQAQLSPQSAVCDTAFQHCRASCEANLYNLSAL